MPKHIYALIFGLLSTILLHSCAEETTQQSSQPQSDSLKAPEITPPENRPVKIYFFETRNRTGYPERDHDLNVMAKKLHNHNSWLYDGQKIALLHVDSPQTAVPADAEIHRFFSTEKVTELRIHDARKIRITWESDSENQEPVISFLLYKNEGNNWRKYMNPGKFTYRNKTHEGDSPLPPLSVWAAELLVLLTYK
ncbi:MAG: hypothetical protein AAF570_12390 [Bacteroidota bacterium]